MSAIAVQIADGVVALLNGAAAGTFDEDFTAERKWLAVVDLEKVKCVKVYVIPHITPRVERATRAEWLQELPTRIVILKKLTGSCEDDRNTQIDGLALLNQQIFDYLRAPARIRLATAEAVFASVEGAMSINEPRLNENHEFIAETVCVYRIQR